MVGVKGNRRIVYTKKVIKQALIELLKVNEIHQITVTDICKNADVNRGTFYTHYKDAYDLLQCMEDELFDQVLEYIDNAPKLDNDVLIIKVLELIKENADLCKILLFRQKDKRIIDRIFYISRKSDIDLGDFDEAYADYMLKFSVGGTISIICTWLERGLVESPEEVVGMLIDINKKLATCF